MSDAVRLTAADGHVFTAHCCQPVGDVKGGVVIVQEIFGVTPHIRAVVQRYADAGYLALAPAFYDRIRPDVQLTAAQVAEALACTGQLQDDNTYTDLAAAVSYAAQAGNVAVIGYCWGGTVAHVAACRLPISAAVSYYGTRTTRYLAESVKSPVQYHFGELDTHITSADIERIQNANPHGEYYVYAGAGHAFNNEQRPDNYQPEAAKIAFARTLAFLHKHLS